MDESIGWEKLPLQLLAWKKLDHVKNIVVNITNHPDMAILSIDYDDGRKDVLVYKKTPLDLNTAA